MDLSTSMRTHMCGLVGTSDIGSVVTVCGWVDRRREHGEHLVFIDLRDHSGVVQCVVDGSHDLRSEYVVQMTGEVRRRPEDTANPELALLEKSRSRSPVSRCCRSLSHHRSRLMSAPRSMRQSGFVIDTSICARLVCSAICGSVLK